MTPKIVIDIVSERLYDVVNKEAMALSYLSQEHYMAQDEVTLVVKAALFEAFVELHRRLNRNCTL